MIPTTIVDRDDVLIALSRIDREGVPTVNQSRGVELRHGGKGYPPKYVISLAFEAATGRALPLSEFITTEAEYRLQGLGFSVIRVPLRASRIEATPSEGALPRECRADTFTVDQLEAGCRAFELREPRDAMYKTATFLVDHFWGRPSDMADSLGVLLLTWNQAHYRYGSFDFGNLEEGIRKYISVLEGYRARTILNYTSSDDPHITELFKAFRIALAIAEGSKRGAQSPVAVAKALHLLAPGFFPLWDKKIAVAYRCDYYLHPVEKYINFTRLSQRQARKLQEIVPPMGKTLLKLIDEYNYARYTKYWV